MLPSRTISYHVSKVLPRPLTLPALTPKTGIKARKKMPKNEVVVLSASWNFIYVFGIFTVIFQKFNFSNQFEAPPRVLSTVLVPIFVFNYNVCIIHAPDLLHILLCLHHNDWNRHYDPKTGKQANGITKFVGHTNVEIVVYLQYPTT